MSLDLSRPFAQPRSLKPTVAMAVIGAILLGGVVVFTQDKGVELCLLLLAAEFILLDFRIGVVLLVVLLPFATNFQVRYIVSHTPGLNPLNLLLACTLASYLVWRLRSTGAALFVPKPVVWLYVVPIVIAGLIGSSHVHEIAPLFLATTPLWFNGPIGYLSAMLTPLTMVMIALLIGAAVARSQRPERLLLPMLVSVWLLCLVALAYLWFLDAGITALANPASRALMDPLGLHANDLGRLYVVAYALMLFAFAEARDGGVRIALAASMVLVVVALTLTFSRSAYLGFALVNLWFMASRRQVTVLLLGGMLFAVLALLLPGAVYERLNMGWGQGLDAVSAGRIDHLWLPLLPELARSPLFGNGLKSILWSNAMHAGSIFIVDHPHNAYLQAALDMGIVGLALLCAYFWHVWKGFRRLAADMTLSPLMRGFYAGAAVGLVSFLVDGITGSSLTPGPPQAFLWLAIGMMYGHLSRRADAAPGIQPLRPVGI
jgi:hypothetical protein